MITFNYLQNGNLNIKEYKEKEEKYYWVFFLVRVSYKKIEIQIYAIYKWHDLNRPGPPINARYELKVDFHL